MADQAGFKLRLRVRTGKPFGTEATELSVDVAGRTVNIGAQNKDQPLSRTTWVVFEARGFDNEVEAREFGEQLQTLVQVAALATRLGLDEGQNRPTSWLNEDFARKWDLIEPQERLFPDIHGLLILPDDNNNRISTGSLRATILADEDQFIDAITSLQSDIPIQLKTASRGIKILNLAILNNQPLAQAVLAFSAVEALGQDEKWTVDQRRLLESLAASASEDPDHAEFLEVANALRRGLHRIGLRQGVLRVLRRLDLNELKDEWDRIYGLRSGVFHGTQNLSEPAIAQLAHDAIVFAGRVILKLLEQDGVTVPAVAGLNFGLIKNAPPPPHRPEAG